MSNLEIMSNLKMRDDYHNTIFQRTGGAWATGRMGGGLNLFQWKKKLVMIINL